MIRTVVAAALLISWAAGLCQFTIVMPAAMRARKLSGEVDGPSGEAIRGARVQLYRCTKNWSSEALTGEAQSETTTDIRGKFAFLSAEPSWQTVCLKVSVTNFRTVELRITKSRFAHKLRIQLPLGV